MATARNFDTVSLWRKALLCISRELNENEMVEMVYLCKDDLPKSEKDSFKKPLTLFDLLEEKLLITKDDNTYLIQHLKEMQREDLVKTFYEKMNPAAAKLVTEIPQQTPLIPPSEYTQNVSSKTTPAGSSPNAPFKASGAQSVDTSKSFHGSQSQSRSRLGSGGNSHNPHKFSSTYKSQTSASFGIPGNLAAGIRHSSHGANSDGMKQKNVTLPELMENLAVVDSDSSKDTNKKGELPSDVETDSAHVSQQKGRVTSPPPQSQGRDSVPPPLVNQDRHLDTDSTEQRHPGVSGDERVRYMEDLYKQKAQREEARAAGVERPTLREYQTELAQRPLQNFGNHIICAPTGSGKTLTAAYICYEYWNWFRRNVTHKNFKALFIVHMRHLTQQQKNAFQEYFPNRQAVRTIGDMQTLADALKIQEEMPAVLMLTAQVFVNALKSTSNSIELTSLDMLIFDECHHTDLKHPFNEIMKVYLKMKQTLPQPQYVGISGGGLPFIIGLSASLGVGHEQTPLKHILALCGNMDAQGVSRVLKNTIELQRHVNSPEEDNIIDVKARDTDDQQFSVLLGGIMSLIVNQLPEVEATKELPSVGTQSYESEVMNRLQEAQKCSDRTSTIVYMYLYNYNCALMLYEDLRVKDGLKKLKKFHDGRYMNDTTEQVPVEDYCERLFNVNHKEMIRMGEQENQHSNHKLAKLAHLLDETFTDNPNSKGIILVRMKVATTAICDFIRSSTLLQALPCYIEARRLVGQGLEEDDCLTEAQQKAVLKSFRHEFTEDGCNILVATDIAQEGLDMPACNFVIRYNFVSNEIGTVQSKGRARAEGSQCYLIVERGSLNERREIENRSKVKKMEEAMVELEAMTENDRLTDIEVHQMKRLEAIRKEEEDAAKQRTMQNLETITIHCKECSSKVCLASDLRRKGDAGHVTCISPEFTHWVKENRYRRPQRYRDTETIGLISCGTVDCKNPFGTIQNFLMLDPPRGYALKAESFKAHFGRLNSVKILKKWNKAGFEIISDKYL